MMKRPSKHTRQLSELLHRPGGITADEAVTAAEQRLDGLRDRGLSDIAATIHDMVVLGSEIDVGPDEKASRELYRLSNSLVGVAGVFGKGELGDVSLSLCTLIERLLLARRWDRDAVQLHLNSLRLLSQDGISPVQTATVIAALRQVVDRARPA